MLIFSIKPPRWVGFDLDGTLSDMSGLGENFLNPPVWIGFPAISPKSGKPEMVLLAKRLISEGVLVKVVTARVGRVTIRLRSFN